ncbi:hypothetical protein BC826DRAFT_726356 [Russula brevipes]|nr:hypothetical protein BC826DRAFT_726356 [Russula brevipes]
MDAVEVPKRHASVARRRPKEVQPRRSASARHVTMTATATATSASTSASEDAPPTTMPGSAPPPLPPPSMNASSGPTLRRSLRRAKSLAAVVASASAAVSELPVTPARRPGKRQKVALAVPPSSSPVLASLRSAQVLFGSGKSLLLLPSFLPAAPLSLFFLLADISRSCVDDSMAAEIEHADGAAPPSSDDDPHLGQVTPHHIFSPAPRRLSSRFFDGRDKA